MIAVLFKESKIEDILVYPTISNDRVNIVLGNEIETEGELLVMDMLGRVIMRTLLSAGTQQHTLEINQLLSGQYVLTIQSGRKVSLGKFVKKE